MNKHSIVDLAQRCNMPLPQICNDLFNRFSVGGKETFLSPELNLWWQCGFRRRVSIYSQSYFLRRLHLMWSWGGLAWGSVLCPTSALSPPHSWVLSFSLTFPPHSRGDCSDSWRCAMSSRSWDGIGCQQEQERKSVNRKGKMGSCAWSRTAPLKWRVIQWSCENWQIKLICFFHKISYSRVSVFYLTQVRRKEVFWFLLQQQKKSTLGSSSALVSILFT